MRPTVSLVSIGCVNDKRKQTSWAAFFTGGSIFGVPLMYITNARLSVVMAFVISIGNMSQEHVFPVGHRSSWRSRHQIIELSDMLPTYT